MAAIDEMIINLICSGGDGGTSRISEIHKKDGINYLNEFEISTSIFVD